MLVRISQLQEGQRKAAKLGDGLLEDQGSDV